MKKSSYVLIILVFLISSAHINSDNHQNNHFPKNWDSIGVFENMEVISWVQFNNTFKPNWHRECLAVEIGKDTMGKQTYTLSNYVYYPPIDSIDLQSGWQLQFSFGVVPNKGRFSSSLVFLDNTKTYNYQPDSVEVYKLLKEWGFTIYKNDFRTTVLGIDTKLWEQVFGWQPERVRLVCDPSEVRRTIIQSYFGEINLNKL